MILDNEKMQLKTLKENFLFLKECLWPSKVRKRMWAVKRRATISKFLHEHIPC